MKKIVAIVLVGFFGFLGCSGSNDSTTATVGQAVPVAPWAIIETSTPTYEWTPVQLATRYRLLVQEAIEDSTTQDTTETYVIDEWYTAEEAGCNSEESLCIVAPDIDVDGAYIWKVMACDGDDCGLWSDDLQFSYPPPATPRFTDNGDGTVTDHNTELMWTKDADLCGTKNWWDATSYCWDLTLADHSDWSLSYISELNSLIDRNQLDPALPPDNPFTNLKSGYYWSSTTDVDDTNSAWDAVFGDGVASLGDKGGGGYVWCVRGGDGRAVPDPYDGGCPDGSCQENRGPYRVYMFENYDSVLKSIDYFGFNLRSWAHSCKDWKKSVSPLGNQLTVNTGTCKSEKSNVAWIKNEVIAKEFTPISWYRIYMLSQYRSAVSTQDSFEPNDFMAEPVESYENPDGHNHETPKHLNFVIYGDFKPRFNGKSYTCKNVMIGMETFIHNYWWFFTNTKETKCTQILSDQDRKTTQVTVACTEDATGKPVLLKVNRKYVAKYPTNSFRVDVCQ